MGRPHLPRPLVRRWTLGCSFCVAIMGNAALNICVQFVWTCPQHSGRHPGAERPGPVFTPRGTANLFQSSCPGCVPASHGRRPDFLRSFANTRHPLASAPGHPCGREGGLMTPVTPIPLLANHLSVFSGAFVVVVSCESSSYVLNTRLWSG